MIFAALSGDEDDVASDPDFNIFEDNRVILEDLTEDYRKDMATRVSHFVCSFFFFFFF